MLSQKYHHRGKREWVVWVEINLGRPTNPKKGTIGFNHETFELEIWDGFTWYGVTLSEIDLYGNRLVKRAIGM